MRIAMVAPTHLPARRANTMQVMKMAQALVGLGHDVRVAAPGRPTQPVTWEELAHLYGLREQFPVEWLPAIPVLRRYDYGLQAVGWARRIGADLLYTRLPQAAAFGSILGIATILESHDIPFTSAGAWLFRRFLRGRGARRLVAITQTLADDLAEQLEAPPAPFTIIAADGVDLERYSNLPDVQQARLELGLQVDRFTAGYTGHLYAGRGIALILKMAQRMPEMGFLLAGGETGEVESLRQTVEASGLENIHLHGFIPNAILPRYHAACDVLLMPYQRHVAASSGGDISRYLSPMKLFEYLASGRVILSSDLPVFREVLSPETAVLLPADDVEAWVNALQALQDDRHTRLALGERGRQHASHYSWEARAKKILDGID